MAIANIFCSFQEIHFNEWPSIYLNVLGLIEVSEWWVFKVIIKSKTESNKSELMKKLATWNRWAFWIGCFLKVSIFHKARYNLLIIRIFFYVFNDIFVSKILRSWSLICSRYFHGNCKYTLCFLRNTLQCNTLTNM